MLAPWQWIFFVLHDLAALTCLTVVLSVTRSFRERGRALTIGVYCFACMLSVANIAALPALERATDYDTAVLIFGAVALLNMILFPQIILRTKSIFLNVLICFSLNTGMEGLFSVFRFVLQGMERHAYLFYETVSPVNPKFHMDISPEFNVSFSFHSPGSVQTRNPVYPLPGGIRE